MMVYSSLFIVVRIAAVPVEDEIFDRPTDHHPSLNNRVTLNSNDLFLKIDCAKMKRFVFAKIRIASLLPAECLVDTILIYFFSSAPMRRIK